MLQRGLGPEQSTELDDPEEHYKKYRQQKREFNCRIAVPHLPQQAPICSHFNICSTAWESYAHLVLSAHIRATAVAVRLMGLLTPGNGTTRAYDTLVETLMYALGDPPLEHAVVQGGDWEVKITPELASGHPHTCDGDAESEPILVALVAAVVMAEPSAPHPCTAAYSAPARAAFPTSICCQSAIPKSSMPIAKVASIDAIRANSIVLTPSTEAETRIIPQSRLPSTRMIPLHRLMLLLLCALARLAGGSFDERRRQ
jgi:hypothetical protein